MKDTSRHNEISAPYFLVRSVAFWLSLALLVLVPLTFSTSVYRTFSLPKFLILLTGSSALLPLIGLVAVSAARRKSIHPLPSHLLLVSAYVATNAMSTAFCATPVAAFFGSYENQMGLLTRLCFFVCFLAIISGIGLSWARLLQTLWAISITGLCIATYAFAQFFGRDLFLPSSLYTVTSTGETVVRAIGTLGHADYLGNYLLYTTPLWMGLALSSVGSTRRFGIVASAVSTAAIAFSGTRGAWLGLIVGGLVFLILELPQKQVELRSAGLRRMALRLTLACVLVLLTVLLIASRQASRSMLVRARSFVTEGFTGAGRTLLWRDSLSMVPAFPLVGCAPEGFRAGFLPYKSEQLARFAPDNNNESSHSSYIDAAVSFGLPGAGLYAAIIASTFALLRRARRQIERRRRVIITGILASFAGITVHNIFIFDQIPTGLYFFAFLALAYVVAKVAESEASPDARDEGSPSDSGKKKDIRGAASASKNRPAVFVLAVSGAVFLALVSYSVLAMDADKQLSRAFVAGTQGNLDQVITSTNVATRFFDPTGQRDFMAARALTLYIERVQAFQNSDQRQTSDNSLTEAKATAINLAMMHANKSLSRTLEPDSNNLLLAYLAFLGGDAAKLREYASEAVKLDPFFPNARWLMAEAYLAGGDRERAAHEAEIALEINPSLRQARSALKRAHGETLGPGSVEELLERAQRLLRDGESNMAVRVLLRSIRRSSGPCAECHRLLALVYEESNLFEDAILECQTFLREAPGRAAAEQTAQRIETLKQKTSR